MLNSKTEIFCILGNPIAHSLSPQMHNAGFQALNLNCIFVAFLVTNLKEALAGIKAIRNIKGIVVTVPFKQKVLKYIDFLDITAKDIGAVNAISIKNSKLSGINTDWTGAIEALEEKTNITGKNVAVIGAGGAAHAISYGLVKKRAKVIVLNRTYKKASLMAKKFNLDGFYNLEQQSKIKSMDIIINTTSVGMEPDTHMSPIHENNILPHHIVFDIIYTPHETKLIKIAKKKGAKVIHGYKMVLYGGKRIFESFTGKKAPIKIMEKVLINNLYPSYSGL